MHVKLWSEYLKGRDHLEDLGEDVSVTLKSIQLLCSHIIYTGWSCSFPVQNMCENRVFIWVLYREFVSLVMTSILIVLRF
jgi:hypothetical protein